jgi:hypothetical protein
MAIFVLFLVFADEQKPSHLVFIFTKSFLTDCLLSVGILMYLYICNTLFHVKIKEKTSVNLRSFPHQFDFPARLCYNIFDKI